MTDCVNCPNCCAPVDLTADKCPYCGTPYPRPRKTAQTALEPVTVQIDARALSEVVRAGIITPNEARRRMGLPRV